MEVCRCWRPCNLRRLRTTTQSLIGLETDRPVTILTARRQTWQGRDSCSGLTQLVRSWESLACLQLCSGSPVGRWWKPCSYKLAAQWRRSCCQWAPRCSAGECWVVGHLRQHFCCSALRRALFDPSHALTHPTLNACSASSSGCSCGDRFGKHFKKCRNKDHVVPRWKSPDVMVDCEFGWKSPDIMISVNSGENHPALLLVWVRVKITPGYG